MASEFCPRCGNARTGAFRFCRSCGFDFDEAPVQSAPPPVAPPPLILQDPVAWPTYPPPDPVATPPAPSAETPAPTAAGTSTATRVVRGLIALLVLVVIGGIIQIGGFGARPAVTAPTSAPTTAAAAGSCTIPPRTYADLQACNGTSQEIELNVAKSFDGKTLARIAIPSKDPAAILAAMGAYTAEWSTGADSFTVFAYGSGDDYENGAGYNRGRVFWNNGGAITVNICTKIEPLEGVDFCTAEAEYTVENK